MIFFFSFWSFSLYLTVKTETLSLISVPTAQSIDLGGSWSGSERKHPEAEAGLCVQRELPVQWVAVCSRAACVSKGRGAAPLPALPRPLFQHLCPAASLFKMQSLKWHYSIRILLSYNLISGRQLWLASSRKDVLIFLQMCFCFLLHSKGQNFSI